MIPLSNKDRARLLIDELMEIAFIEQKALPDARRIVERAMDEAQRDWQQESKGNQHERNEI